MTKAWLPAKQIVEKALKERTEVDASGQIIRLTAGGVPWKVRGGGRRWAAGCACVWGAGGRGGRGGGGGGRAAAGQLRG